MPDDPNAPDAPVTMLRGGKAVAVPADQVDEALRQGFEREDTGQRLGRLQSQQRDEDYGGVAGGIAAGGAAVLRGLTAGGSDVALRALGEQDDFRNLKEANSGISTGGEIVGAVGGAFLGAGPASSISEIGANVARTAEGAGLGTAVGRGIAGGAVEGGLFGFGSGVSDLALQEDPLTVEHAASVLSSNVLFGAAVGGGLGGLTKSAERGLMSAKSALEGVAAQHAAVGALDGDLAAIAERDGMKGLNAAAKAEEDAVKAARVPEQQKFVDELKAHRQALNDEKIWLATKDVDAKAIGSVKEIAKISYDADKSIRSLLNNPKNLAENPRRALEALQRQENALEMLTKEAPALRTVFAADASGTRAAALDALPGALERNQGLQGKVREFMAPPSSPRYTAIQNAKEALSAKPAAEGFGEKIGKGAVYSAVTGFMHSLPIPGSSMLAPFVGAGVSNMIGSKVFGRLGKAAGEQAARAARAAGTFLDVTRKAAPYAPVLATKVLSAVRYAPESSNRDQPEGKSSLASVYKQRTDEIKSQTAYGPTGVPVMRPEARKAMAANLAPIRAAQPVLADRMETIAARRIEFLSSKIPRRPDLGTLQTGPDHWKPSDMEMRTFARYAAAAEDPGGIEERLASGAVTPEDAEVMKNVYPERMAEITRQIMEKLPTLRESLPYQRRLALSIFSGAPVDAAMNPRILAQLQSSFSNEEGSEGGTQAPRATPQFGSVSSKAAPEPTPAQSRGG